MWHAPFATTTESWILKPQPMDPSGATRPPGASGASGGRPRRRECAWTRPTPIGARRAVASARGRPRRRERAWTRPTPIGARRAVASARASALERAQRTAHARAARRSLARGGGAGAVEQRASRAQRAPSWAPRAPPASRTRCHGAHHGARRPIRSTCPTPTSTLEHRRSSEPAEVRPPCAGRLPSTGTLVLSHRCRGRAPPWRPRRTGTRGPPPHRARAPTALRWRATVATP